MIDIDGKKPNNTRNMITGPKRGFYYYLMLSLSIIGVPFAFLALYYLKLEILNGTLMENISRQISALAIIMTEFLFIAETFKHSQGYTTVVTTKYNLYKCRQSGTDESFMMFADNEDELEIFFEITQPDKRFFIEPANIEGKSVKMKIFNEN